MTPDWDFDDQLTGVFAEDVAALSAAPSDLGLGPDETVDEV